MTPSPPNDRSGEQPDRSRRDANSIPLLRGARRLSGTQQRLGGVLARYQHRPLIDVSARIYRRDGEAAGSVVGSAVAFRLFLFLVPFLLFLVGLLGIAARWVTVEYVSEQTGVSGSLVAQIDSALSQSQSSSWAAAILGLLGMAWAGRTLSKVMVAASCLAWRMPVQPRASMRIVGAIVGFVAGIGLVAVIVNRIRSDLGLAVVSFSFVAAIVIYALAWIAVSMLLPRATTDPGALLPGAVLVGLSLAGMQAVSQLYLPGQVARASALYGTIGATTVTLGWFFILGRTIVLAMVLNAVIHERFGSISQAVFALPVLRTLPRRSTWIRRFFDLDSDTPPRDS